MPDDPLIIPEYVPVFPLPEVVLFPRALLPLHIFEPRYQAMTADALAGARCIAVALLKPGFEPLYYTRRAPIHDVLGLGRIVASEELKDGKYNILLRGEGRVRLVEERSDRPYRQARVVSLPTRRASQQRITQLRRELRSTIQESPLAEPDFREHWLDLFKARLALGDLVDLISAGLPVQGELRQCLLAEPDAAARAALLLESLRTLNAVRRRRGALGHEDSSYLN